MKCGVYLFINTVNGKVYVGSAVNLKRRMIHHRCDLNKGRHTNEHLLRAWRAYGADAFRFEVLEYCEPEERLEREQWWILLLDSLNGEKGYNKITARPGGGMKGRRHTEATKAKLAAAARAQEERTGQLARLAAMNRGRKWSEEQKSKLKGRTSGWKGRTPSLEARAKMSAAKQGKSSWNKGVACRPETKEKLVAANLGKTASVEARAKMSSAQMGRPGWNKGKKCPHSEETKAKISATHKAMWEARRMEIVDGA
jgi:group I intron endonuclease